MNAILDLTEKDNFAVWILFSTFGTLIVCFASRLIIKNYYYKKALEAKDEQSIDKNLEIKEYGPDIFLNSVFKIIVSITCIFAVLFLNQILGILFDLFGLPDAVSDISLFLLTVMSIMVNNIIDKKWTDRKWPRSIKGDESYAEQNFPTESLRLLSGFFVLMILLFSWVCFKIISFQVFVMMLVIFLGRFIFFDTKRKNIKESIYSIRKIWKSALVALILICICMGSAVYFDVLSYSDTPLLLFGIHFWYLFVVDIIKNIVDPFE